MYQTHELIYLLHIGYNLQNINTYIYKHTKT